jgi:hypothetical protein
MNISDAAKLCLDTCVYLDFLDRAFMGKQITNEITRYETLIKNSSFCLVAPAIISDEYKRNVDNVTERKKIEIREIIKKWNGLEPVHRAIDPLLEGLILNQGVGERAIDYLKNKSQDLIDWAITIESDGNLEIKAFARMVTTKLPGKRGKNSSGDCLICETILTLTAALRAGGFDKKVVFVSTNKDDFGDNSARMSGKLHPDLLVEFTPLNIDYEPVLATPLFNTFS